VYRFGQEKRAYGKVMVGYLKPLMELACEIAESFGEYPNHCIIVCKNNGKEHHIPCICYHHQHTYISSSSSDKQEGTSGGGA
jgi:hypothetical protein